MTIKVIPMYDHSNADRLVSLIIAMETEQDLADVTKGLVDGINSFVDRPPELNRALTILWEAGEGKAVPDDDVARLRELLRRVLDSHKAGRPLAITPVLVAAMEKELAPRPISALVEGRYRDATDEEMRAAGLVRKSPNAA